MKIIIYTYILLSKFENETFKQKSKHNEIYKCLWQKKKKKSIKNENPSL